MDQQHAQYVVEHGHMLSIHPAASMTNAVPVPSNMTTAMQALNQCQLCRLWYISMALRLGQDQALCEFVVKSVQGITVCFLGWQHVCIKLCRGLTALDVG